MLARKHEEWPTGRRSACPKIWREPRAGGRRCRSRNLLAGLACCPRRRSQSGKGRTWGGSSPMIQRSHPRSLCCPASSSTSSASQAAARVRRIPPGHQGLTWPSVVAHHVEGHDKQILRSGGHRELVAVETPVGRGSDDGTDVDVAGP